VPQPTAPTHAPDDNITISGKIDGIGCYVQYNSGMLFCESGYDSLIMGGGGSPGLDGDLQGFCKQLFQKFLAW
jgi:hypothetical protein